MRFVVVSTLLRGVLKTPEVLDDANQWRAFSAWREDESRGERVEFELDAARRELAGADSGPDAVSDVVVWAEWLAQPFRGERKALSSVARRVG